MNLLNSINSFIKNPFPLWEKELTFQLVIEEWDLLSKQLIVPEQYSTAKGYFKDNKLLQSNKVKIYGETAFESIYIEYPQYEILKEFYHDTGLEPLTQKDVDSTNGIEKVNHAFITLSKVSNVLECISQLVKCISILRQDDPEIDTSHSDPNIPFSIFISVCEDSSEICNLRLAESILHEAMHLKLTMIEHHIDLVVPGTTEMFYSPWRDEQRHVRGVLHGLFVFKAIYEFYSILLSITNHERAIQYLTGRITDIKREFSSLTNFHSSIGLTPMGASLIKNLLPLS